MQEDVLNELEKLIRHFGKIRELRKVKKGYLEYFSRKYFAVIL